MEFISDLFDKAWTILYFLVCLAMIIYGLIVITLPIMHFILDITGNTSFHFGSNCASMPKPPKPFSQKTKEACSAVRRAVTSKDFWATVAFIIFVIVNLIP